MDRRRQSLSVLTRAITRRLAANPSRQQFVRVRLHIDDEAHEADRHFVRRLRTILHVDARIRIVRIVFRVIEVGDRFEPRAFGQHHGLGELVPELPVEIELSLQQKLRFTRWIERAQFVVLGAQMHVRLDPRKLRLRLKRRLRLHLVVRRARRNHEAGIVDAGRSDITLPRRLAREHNPDLRPVGLRLSAWSCSGFQKRCPTRPR